MKFYASRDLCEHQFLMLLHEPGISTDLVFSVFPGGHCIYAIVIKFIFLILWPYGRTSMELRSRQIMWAKG